MDQRGQVMDLYVIRIVPSCSSQLVPARTLIMLIRDEAREMTVNGGEKMKWVSIVTPSNRGFLSRCSRDNIFNISFGTD